MGKVNERLQLTDLYYEKQKYKHMTADYYDYRKMYCLISFSVLHIHVSVAQISHAAHAKCI